MVKACYVRRQRVEEDRGVKGGVGLCNFSRTFFVTHKQKPYGRRIMLFLWCWCSDVCRLALFPNVVQECWRGETTCWGVRVHAFSVHYSEMSGVEGRKCKGGEKSLYFLKLCHGPAIRFLLLTGVSLFFCLARGVVGKTVFLLFFGGFFSLLIGVGNRLFLFFFG